MIYKNQFIVIAISFLIAGFFVLSSPESGFSGTTPGGPPCCDFPLDTVCTGDISQETCEINNGVWLPSGVCIGEEEGDGRCVSQIPTLSQWGKIITIAVIGVFGVIGLIIMRRTVVVRSYQD